MAFATRPGGGSTIAQVSPRDVRLAISSGLGWPKRVPGVAKALDWTQPETWDLFPLDHETFPAVELAHQVGRAGGSAPAVYDAANEVRVQAFVDQRLPWLGIVDTIARIVADLGARPRPVWRTSWLLMRGRGNGPRSSSSDRCWWAASSAVSEHWIDAGVHCSSIAVDS